MERTRRLRMNERMRDMVRENHVRVDELIYPIFVIEGENICEPVESMPGICQYSIDRLYEELDRVREAGIPAVLYAKAGADIIAPSDMMDKRVEAIRKALDEEGLYNTPIMSYSAKFASAYYGPFRDAAHSAPGFGDRKSYQMDPANGEEALREVEQDIKEGADLIIAKPAMAYLDVLKDISIHYNIPIVAYNVSGEYAMVKAAAQKGWIDEKRIVMEHMIGFKRAGAKMIITYHALDVARWLKEEQKEQ